MRRTPRACARSAAAPEAVRVVGNLKFDAAKLHERRMLDVPTMLRQLGVPADAQILVAGSTHDGEEILLAEMARRLRARFPKLFLVLVPRHFERCGELGRKLRERGCEIGLSQRDFRQHAIARGRNGMPARQHDRRAAVFLRARDGRVRRQKSDGDGRAKSDRAGRAGQGDGFRAEYAEFRGCDAEFSRARRGGAGARPGGVGKNRRECCWRTKTGARRWGATHCGLSRENLGAVDRTVEMILEKLKPRGIYITPKK